MTRLHLQRCPLQFPAIYPSCCSARQHHCIKLKTSPFHWLYLFCTAKCSSTLNWVQGWVSFPERWREQPPIFCGLWSWSLSRCRALVCPGISSLAHSLPSTVLSVFPLCRLLGDCSEIWIRKISTKSTELQARCFSCCISCSRSLFSWSTSWLM